MEIAEIFAKFNGAAISLSNGHVQVRMMETGAAVVTFDKHFATCDVLDVKRTAEEFGAPVGWFGQKGLKFERGLDDCLAILELSI